MKKNLVRLLSVILAVVMVFPAAVFADDSLGGDVELWCGTDQNNTYDLVKDGGVKLDDVTNWSKSGDGSISLDESTGVVTALEPGSAVLTAIRSSKNEESGDWETDIVGTWYFTIKKRTAQSIAVTTPPTKTSYISGQTFDPTGMVITATCNNGEKLTVPLANCIFTPNPLTADTDAVTITWGELTTTQGVTVGENAVTKVSIYSAPSEAYVGDKLSDLDIKVQVTWANGDTAIIENGWDAVPSGALTKDVKTFYVTFQNVKSESRNIKVIDKPTEGGGSGGGSGSGGGTTTTDYTLAVSNAPSKRTYSVGDTFDTTGLSIIVRDSKNTYVTTLSGASLQALAYTFSDADRPSGATTTSTIYLSVIYSGKEYKVPITGLTVTAAKKTLDYKVSNHVLRDFVVTLVKDSYPVGSTMSLDEIYRITFKDTYGNTVQLTRSDLNDYSHTFSLEVSSVQTSSGSRDPITSRKSSYRTRIENSNIYTYLNNEEVVFLRFYIDDTDYCEFECPSGEGAVSVYNSNTYSSSALIGVYSTLAAALDDVNDVQYKWNNSSTPTYAASRTLYIKLNHDETIEHYDYWIPARNIGVDLNGHKLTMYTDTFRFRDKYDSYSVSFSNNASDPANIIYKDYTIAGKDATLLIDGKNETITFKFQEDSSVIPGIYTVTVAEIKEGGTVTASPALSSKNTVSIAHGNDVTFTITPQKDKNFEIDTVKIKKGSSAESTVSTTTNSTVYSVNSTSGIATYTLKDVITNCTLTATFKSTKKEETKPEEQKPAETPWTNPFSDVNIGAGYYDAVKYVYQNGLMDGMTKPTFGTNGSIIKYGTFGPERTMTRAEFVTTLGRMYLGSLGIPNMETTAQKYENMLGTYGLISQFTDVSDSGTLKGWAVPYIIWAEKEGLVQGVGNDKFDPQGLITHQQMYIIMYRYAQYIAHQTINVDSVELRAYDKNSVGASWSDVPPKDKNGNITGLSPKETAIRAAKYAYQQSFMVDSYNIKPSESATRGELALLLQLFTQNVLKWN